MFTRDNTVYSLPERARLFMTTGEDDQFTERDALSFVPDGELKNSVRIEIDITKRYQTILGFGASFTDSAAYLINQKLSDEDKTALMSALFDPAEGIGLSFTRQPMGASDFARTVYSYDDRPSGETDEALAYFSIGHDKEDIIPLLQWAQRLNPDLLMMASPWSPPGWMKTGGSMIGGSLKPEYYEAYAAYFVKYIQAYAEEGLEIYAVTPQNEPLYVPNHYPGCSMSALEQASFIRTALGPAFQAANLSTKILCYDHNWDNTAYAEGVLSSLAADYVDGVAWHVYGGEPSAQTKVLELFPDTEVYFTEASGGEWVPPFSEAFISTMVNGIEVLNNYGRCVVLWNMALDEQNGPVVPGFGRSTCRGVVTVNQQTGELTYNLDYYALAHFSKFIRPGAVRVDCESKGSVCAAACLNSDNTLTVVLANEGKGNKPVRLALSGQALDIDVPGRSALTIVIPLTPDI